MDRARKVSSREEVLRKEQIGIKVHRTGCEEAGEKQEEDAFGQRG